MKIFNKSAMFQFKIYIYFLLRDKTVPALLLKVHSTSTEKIKENNDKETSISSYEGIPFRNFTNL